MCGRKFLGRSHAIGSITPLPLLAIEVAKNAIQCVVVFRFLPPRLAKPSWPKVAWKDNISIDVLSAELRD